VFAGGSNTERTRDNFCYAASDATIGLVRDVRPPFLTQYKFHGSYPMPFWGLSASATFRARRVRRSLRAARRRTRGSRHRSDATCRTAPTARRQSPFANGVLFGDRLNQTDFRLAKSIKVLRGPQTP
jgi:hypothetical protein